MTFFIDCTHTSSSDLNTGIQRVVRNIVNNSYHEAGDRDVVPIRIVGDSFIPITGYLSTSRAPRKATAKIFTSAIPLINIEKYLRGIYNASRNLLISVFPVRSFAKFLMAPKNTWGLSKILLSPLVFIRSFKNQKSTNYAPEVHPGKGDVIILLDSNWLPGLWPTVKAAKARGALIMGVCYDLIPLTHPQFCDASLVEHFTRSTHEIAHLADGFVCISKTVANQLRRHLESEYPTIKATLPIEHFWLGSDMDGEKARTNTALDKRVQTLASKSQPIYIYVSTIEPRKNHAYALSAFDILWKSGIDAQFIMVGRVGWLCEDLINRIRGNFEYGQRLHLLHNIDDAQLEFLYQRANGLVFTSFTEGFGLPIVEALQRGVPVFASDIPVFREIGDGQGVSFVNLDTPNSLAGAIQKHISSGAARLPKGAKWLNWRESTRMFWSAVDACIAQIRQTGRSN